MEPLIIVSADGHAGAPVETYRDYLEPKYRHLIPELIADEKKHQTVKGLFNFHDPDRLAVVDDRKRLQTGGVTGAWDPQRRLEELDAEGIAAELLYPGIAEAITPLFFQYNRPYPADVRMAGARAYHRWLADMIAPAKGRLIGTAEAGPSLNMDETLDELRFVAARGFRATYVPGFVPDPALPPLTHRYFEPFWAACSDLGLVLTLHVGYGKEQTKFTNMIDQVVKVTQKIEQAGDTLSPEDKFELLRPIQDLNDPDSVFFMDLGQRQGCWQLIFSGVFDRYPQLKLVIAELRGDWVPACKAHLDQRYLAAKNRPKLKRMPSEYFGENVFVVPSSPQRAEAEQRHAIGVKNFLFGADYPHPEGTWPNTLAWLRTVFHDVAEDELRAILGENAIKVYGLDRKSLAGIAAKIGPRPSDILGNHRVDPRVITDFELRAYFTTPSPKFDQQQLNHAVDNVLAATTG